MKHILISSFLMLGAFSLSAQSIRFELIDVNSNQPASGVQILLTSGSRTIQGISDANGIWNSDINPIPGSTVKFRSGFYLPFDTAMLEFPKTLIIFLKPSVYLKDEVVVSGLRNNSSPNVQVISQTEIKQNNSGRDLPFLLSQVPGSVVQSDAGNGIGYTGIRIRGVDPSRINTTVNGIPLNDAESQTVFWVNMPDFASSSSRIEVSRGVGGSTNGTANFGAGINLETGLPSTQPFAQVTLGGGTIFPMPSGYTPFNATRWSGRVSAQFGTGLQNGWYATGRLSKINSNGFVDRSNSDLRSYYVESGRITKRWVLRLIHFSGREETGQAWNGIPFDTIFNRIRPNRTYNEFTYPGQVDHYGQDHFQFFVTHKWNDYWQVNLAAHYTKGKGYYEEYKSSAPLDYYGIISNAYDSMGNKIGNADLIRRRWLDNQFYGNTWSIQYARNQAQWLLGGSWNRYDGHHLGEVIWSRFAGETEIRHPYYKGHSLKTEFNTYLKWNKTWNSKWKTWADMQVRHINYSLHGQDDNSGTMIPCDTVLTYTFFNPKAGLQYQLNNENVFSFTAGSVGREPLRSDIIQAARRQFPMAERLYNAELGFTQKHKDYMWWINAFYMGYRNQLIADGSINDVGAYNRINLPKSYRGGIEAGGRWIISKLWEWQGNICLSQNKVIQFNQYIDVYDSNYNWTGNAVFGTYKKADLAFSPNLVASSALCFKPFKGWELAWQMKHVSRQFLDNTQSESRSLRAFTVNDLRVTYRWKGCSVNAWLYNALNAIYEPNGYSFMGLVNGVRQDYNYYYPMAGRNLMVSFTAGF